MFDQETTCDVCRKRPASQEVEWDKLSVYVRIALSGGKPLDDYELASGELACGPCYELLLATPNMVDFPGITSIKELKTVPCNLCEGTGWPVRPKGRKKRGYRCGGAMQRCRACRGCRYKLAIKTPLERLADAAE